MKITELEKQLHKALDEHPTMEEALRQVGPGYPAAEIAKAIYAVAYRAGCSAGEEEVCKDLEMVAELRRKRARDAERAYGDGS